MLGNEYVGKIRNLLDRLEGEQMKNITAAARMIADSIAAGGALHRFDTSHVREEAIYRAGGLIGVRNINFDFDVSHDKPPKFEESRKARIEGDNHADEALARHALRCAHLQTGDVLIVISNSGKTGQVVEAAVAARAAGVKVVAITALQFSRSATSQHSSGKRLFEVADVVIDNCGPPGDAILEVDGLDTNACPTSGVLCATINWVLTAEIIEQLLARGIKPEIYRSINLPDGTAYNERAEKRFHQKGI